MKFVDVMETAVRTFEAIGVTILVVTATLALLGYVVELARGRSASQAFIDLRARLGRGILLGLEILVIADIIRTITITPTLSGALTLGAIVLVRVLLSFAIDVEVDGVVPWRKGPAEPS